MSMCTSNIASQEMHCFYGKQEILLAAVILTILPIDDWIFYLEDQTYSAILCISRSLFDINMFAPSWHIKHSYLKGSGLTFKFQF